MILATAGVTTARPPTPPASSAAEDSESFLEGLKQVEYSHYNSYQNSCTLLEVSKNPIS